MNSTKYIVLSICLITTSQALSARVNGGRKADERDTRSEAEESSFYNDRTSLITQKTIAETDETMDDISSPNTATLSAINKHLKDHDREMEDMHMAINTLNRKVEKNTRATIKSQKEINKTMSK